jgi:hypothetical protein
MIRTTKPELKPIKWTEKKLQRMLYVEMIGRGHPIEDRYGLVENTIGLIKVKFENWVSHTE